MGYDVRANITVTGDEPAAVHAALDIERLYNQMRAEQWNNSTDPARDLLRQNQYDLIYNILSYAYFDTEGRNEHPKADGSYSIACESSESWGDRKVYVLEYLASCGFNVTGECIGEDGEKWGYITVGNVLTRRDMTPVADDEYARLMDAAQTLSALRRDLAAAETDKEILTIIKTFTSTEESEPYQPMFTLDNVLFGENPAFQKKPAKGAHNG